MTINKSRVLIFSRQSLNCQLIWRRRLQTVSDVASLCKLMLMVKLSVGWNPCLDLINVKSFRTLLKGHKHSPHKDMNVSDYTWPTCVSPVNTLKECSNAQVEETKDSPRRDTVLISVSMTTVIHTWLKYRTDEALCPCPLLILSVYLFWKLTQTGETEQYHLTSGGAV